MKRSAVAVLCLSFMALVISAGCEAGEGESRQPVQSTGDSGSMDADDGGEDARETGGQDADRDIGREDVRDARADAEGEDAADEDADGAGQAQLIGIEALNFVGAFRVPSDDFGVSNMNYSQGAIAYDARDHSVYLVGQRRKAALAQFAVPDIVASTNVADLEMAASPLQPFVNVLDRVDNPQNVDRVMGLALIDGGESVELLVNAVEYYDAPADNTDTTLMVRDPLDLAASSIDGYFSLDGHAHASGWISPIPPEFQEALGGTYITGNSASTPIAGRHSIGPSAFVFDPLDIVGTDRSGGPVSTQALLDFDLTHPLSDDRYNEQGANDLWTVLSSATYGFIAPGTRTYITLGYSGGHNSEVCYKCTPNGEDQNCPGPCAVDPTDYSTYYWLWDVDDLAAVQRGEMQPYEVRPYDYGEFHIPFETDQIGGGAYDPASNRLYLTALAADREQGQYSNPPIIMVYEVDSSE